MDDSFCTLQVFEDLYLKQVYLFSVFPFLTPIFLESKIQARLQDILGNIGVPHKFDQTLMNFSGNILPLINYVVLLPRIKE